jgi:hypothetical protein
MQWDFNPLNIHCVLFSSKCLFIFFLVPDLFNTGIPVVLTVSGHYFNYHIISFVSIKVAFVKVTVFIPASTYQYKTASRF